MCGICGILGPNDRGDRAAMLRAIGHRGPDDEGSVELPGQAFGSVWLGHRRLAILDLSARAHQPMVTSNGRYTIVANGEIYNFREIRAYLSAHGRRFAGSGDTEVLLAAWEEWGDACVERLRGMFAFALWDAEEGALWLVRDRMGEKPLYFATRPEGLVFGSEVRALLASRLIDPVLSRDGLESYLAFGSVSQPLTLIRGVWAVEPGQIVKFHEGRMTRRDYWRLSAVETRADEDGDDAVEAVRAVLDASIGRCQVSDVPIGLLLSGGVDSTTILARMARRGDSLPATFSVGFTGRNAHLSELGWSDQVAASFGTDHHRVEIAPADIGPLADEAVAAMDQPSKDGVNHFIALKAVAGAGFKVAITGQGADELFFGYGNHRSYGASIAVAHLGLPRLVRRAFEQGAIGLAPDRDRFSKLAMLFGPGEPEHLAYLARHLVFTHQEIEELLGTRCDPPARFVGSAGGDGMLDRLYRLETTRLLRNQLLRDGDQMSMAVSLELRSPFVDHELVERVFGIPERFKVCRSTVKPFLLRAADHPLVTQVSRRPKVGFTIPLHEWLGSRNGNRSALDPARLGFQAAAVEGHARHAKRGVRFERYWTLLVLDQWMERHGVRPQ